jgi:hypothetical protein
LHLCLPSKEGQGRERERGIEIDGPPHPTYTQTVLARGEDWDVPFFCTQDCYDSSAEARHVFPQNTFFIVGTSCPRTLA